MRKILIVALAAVLIIVITGGYLGYTYLSSQNEDNKPITVSVDQIRDRAMLYLAANHTVSMPLMTDFSWSGGRQDTGSLVGSETYLYCSANWSVSVQYPVVPDPIYTITANYSAPGVLLSWVAEYQNGAICEKSNDFTGTLTYLTQEQIRDLTLNYIKTYHNETAPYMRGMMWTGGRIDMGMMLGSDRYSYQSSGWNVTMQNPVVPNPPYTITVQYNSPPYYQAAPPAMITWQGTLQNGTITETAYTYSP